MTRPYSETGDRITPLFDLPSPFGVVQAVRIDYAPGGHTPGSYRHPAGAYVYVLEGAVRMGLNHQEPLVLGQGETLYEDTDDLHTVSANASSNEPASLIAFFALAPGQPSIVFERSPDAR
jgi:quercetin dioxygenase-like cupin family protein